MIDTKRIFRDFNHSKFVVFSCLLPAELFLSLYLDNVIDWSLWLVLLPIWTLKVIVIVGALIGTIVWCHKPFRRNEADGFTDFKSMLITVGIQVLLLLFELLLCNKVESNSHISWIFVFMPIYLVSPLSIGACIWGYKNARSLELEGLISLNILLFVFVSLKLDGIIHWTWSVIFIPMWIIMCLPTIVVLHHVWTLAFLSVYTFFAWVRLATIAETMRIYDKQYGIELTEVRIRSNFHGLELQTLVLDTIMWIAIDIPLLTFQILLTCRLDKQNDIPWTHIFIPLHICLLALIWSTFGKKGGNTWWFGLREDFCTCFLRACPFMRLYGNIECKKQDGYDESDEMMALDEPKVVATSPAHCGTVVPVTHIATPD